MIFIVILLCCFILGMIIAIYYLLKEFEMAYTRMNYLLNKILDNTKY